MNSKPHARPGNSSAQAPRAELTAHLTELELRELIEETALLHARRQGRRVCSVGDWTEAESEVLRRLAL